ncbi:MAG: hypothetical protein GX094_08520 [Clostridiales bacterium]|jgi:hypothetical protein|nr:hypothetical protein [Clostridiales bacterium]
MSVAKRDRDILRELGKQIAEIAALPVQQETIKAWKALNSLKPVRPMVMIDQIPWHEMDVDGELVLQTEDDFCRGIETELRRKLYAWKHMRADMVIEPYIDVSKVIGGADLGIRPLEKTAVLDPNNNVVGHQYIDQLTTEEDLEKIKMPQIYLDEKATAELEEKAHEIFDGILEVRMQGMFPSFAVWDRIVEWHGVENSLIDLIERPGFIHKILSRVTDAYLLMLDQLEKQGLLGYGQGTIHCSGAYTDELPAADFDPKRPRAKDLWTCGMAQIFSTVSPAMHQEFELDYAEKWYKRFGLVYYGCCEPLHNKLDIVRKIPNLRKISMSPWVDQEKGAEKIGPDFVFSRKPNPAFLAGDSWDPAVVEEDLRKTLEICTRNDCPVEFILKDISTVRYQPQRLWQWADIAMKVVQG